MKIRAPIHPITCSCFSCRPLMPGEHAPPATMRAVWGFGILGSLILGLLTFHHAVRPLLMAAGLLQH